MTAAGAEQPEDERKPDAVGADAGTGARDLDRLDLDSGPSEDELARSEREAAEALRSGAFEGARDTVRVRREDIAKDAGLGAQSPLVAASAPPERPAPVVADAGLGASPADPSSSGEIRRAPRAKKTEPKPEPAAAPPAPAPAAPAEPAPAPAPEPPAAAAPAPEPAPAPAPAPTNDPAPPVAEPAPVAPALVAETAPPVAPVAEPAAVAPVAEPAAVAPVAEPAAGAPVAEPAAVAPPTPDVVSDEKTGTLDVAATARLEPPHLPDLSVTQRLEAPVLPSELVAPAAPDQTARFVPIPADAPAAPVAEAPVAEAPAAAAPVGEAPPASAPATPAPAPVAEPAPAAPAPIAEAATPAPAPAPTPDPTPAAPAATTPAAEAPASAPVQPVAPPEATAAAAPPQSAIVTEKFDARKVEAAVAATPPSPAKPAAPKTGKVAKAPPAKRTEEDDRLVAALVFLDIPSDIGAPNPFTTVGGSTLLKRVGASLNAAGLERVILAATAFDGDRLERVKTELSDGGYTGPVETWDGKTTPPFGERGRVLILDAASMHDPPAVGRLAKFKGERGYVLVSTEGDGIRVQVEGGRVTEVGANLVPFDGVTGGAINLPIPLFERMSELGAMGALVALARDGLLGASVERRSVAREIGSPQGLADARQRLIDRASGGAHDTVINRILGRRLSRPLTSVLVSLGISPPLVTTASLFLGLLGAALLTGIGLDPAPAVLIAGILLLVGSAVLDCVDDELASMAVNSGALWRVFDVMADGIVAAAALAGLGVGAQAHGVTTALVNGAVAAGGAIVATVLLVFARIPFDESRDTSDTLASFVETLARRLVNREVVYVLGLVVAAHLGAERFAPQLRPGIVLEYSLLGLAAVSHAYWAMLALLLLLRPKKK